MNPILLAFLATLFTYIITILGASIVFLFKNFNQKILDIMMGFAGGVMIAASFWSLLAPAISLLEQLNRPKYLETSIGFVLGGSFILLSDIFLSKKIKVEENKKKILLITSAVTLHNIPEGMAVGVAFGSLSLNIPEVSLIGACLLALGIGLQNFPEGLCVSLPLRKSGMSRKKAFFYGQMSGIVEPIFGVIAAIGAMFIQNIMPFLLSFSAGAMIAVVTSELIPDSFKDNKLLASIGLLLGFSVMMILDVALG